MYSNTFLIRMRAMAAVRAAMEGVGADFLGLSVPNVAHADLAVQLLMGRWEVMDAGLLDRTHLSLFTERRLNSVLDDFGFTTVERFDTILPVTEQHDPPDAPGLDANTPLGSAAPRLAFVGGRTREHLPVHRRVPT